MEHTLSNCITECLLEDYLPARDATHKEDERQSQQAVNLLGLQSWILEEESGW